MNEIYWLTRFDALYNIFGACLAVGIIFTVVCTIAYIVNRSEEEKEDLTRFFKKKLNWSIPLLIIGALGLAFTPTTKEAFLIYGVGGSIDYLKENPTAKQLPDKVINLLDDWIDEIAPDKETNRR